MRALATCAASVEFDQTALLDLLQAYIKAGTSQDPDDRLSLPPIKVSVNKTAYDGHIDLIVSDSAVEPLQVVLYLLPMGEDRKLVVVQRDPITKAWHAENKKSKALHTNQTRATESTARRLLFLG